VYVAALHFCDAFTRSRQKGILVDVFNVNVMDYPGPYGLVLVSSINPLALFEEL